MKEALIQGSLLLNGRRVKPTHILEPGAYTLTSLDSFEPPRAHAGRLVLPIAYEDSELLVVDKPSGTPSVPHSSDEIETAVSFALAHCPALAGIGGSALEPGLLHRLDTGTSGLLAFAKSQSGFDRLKQAWGSGEVKKTYRAIVHGQAPGEATTHRLSLAHDAKSSKRMRVIEDGKTRDSQIRGKPLATVTDIVRTHARKGDLADLEIQIHTGVLHQIRCTMAHLGAPVLGDPVYGKALAPRLWLHAWKLRIPSPANKSGDIEIVSPLPKDWPLS